MAHRIWQMLAIAVFLLSSVASAQPTFVEGHVFNKLTGVPLQNAFVAVETEIPLPVPFCEGCSRFLGTWTDSSGFYSFEFSEAEVDLLAADPSIGIVASCVVSPGKSRKSEFNQPIALRSGTARRDLYINASRKRSFARCLGAILQPRE